MTEPKPQEQYYTAHPVRILTFDISTKAVGWCYALGDRYVESGRFRPSRELDVDRRIYGIAYWTEAMLDEHAPDLVGIEKPMPHRGNFHTDRVLARVCGVVEGVCIAHSVPRIIYVHPMRVKGTPYHKGATEAAARLAGKDEVSGDEADAIGLWQVALGELQARMFERRTEEGQ